MDEMMKERSFAPHSCLLDLMDRDRVEVNVLYWDNCKDLKFKMTASASPYSIVGILAIQNEGVEHLLTGMAVERPTHQSSLSIRINGCDFTIRWNYREVSIRIKNDSTPSRLRLEHIWVILA